MKTNSWYPVPLLYRINPSAIKHFFPVLFFWLFLRFSFAPLQLWMCQSWFLLGFACGLWLTGACPGSVVSYVVTFRGSGTFKNLMVLGHQQYFSLKDLMLVSHVVNSCRNVLLQKAKTGPQDCQPPVRVCALCIHWHMLLSCGIVCNRSLRRAQEMSASCS